MNRTSAGIIDSTFLVCGGGLRVPVDGPLQIEEVEGEFYVVGHSTWELCDSIEHAQRRLNQRVRELGPDFLAAEALAAIGVEPA